MKSTVSGPAGVVPNTAVRQLIAVAVLLTGAAIAVTLGVLGTHFGPVPRPLPTWGFSAPQTFKAYLSSLVLVFILAQLLTAVWIYRWHAGRWVHRYHRIAGALTFTASLPVGYYCLYSFGFHLDDGIPPRILVHSIAGIAFYGAFAAKMLALRLRNAPAWLVPVLGALVFGTFVLAWSAAALWWFHTVGFSR
ncbi:DUF6529 family protein [Nocardia sp. NBC_01327]|uniref:DUF6529 family protein n=1 Tax=Nocardia sp. NBC_01327 TaxID=2903593 RepID=UPI002E0D8C46|nr:DUF6529 family protein [Nocardia sp. NBC_01327]